VTLLAAIALGIAVAALALAASPPVTRASLVPPVRPDLAPRALLRRWRRYRSRERAAAGALGVLGGTHAALRSGLPLALALRGAIEDVDPRITEPFARALRAFDLNGALDAALRAEAAGVRDRRLVLALEALALVAGEQLPASRAAAVIASVADRLTFEEHLLAEVRARTSGLRAQIVLLALLVPALALYLVATMPGLASTLSTSLGTHVLIPAAVLFEIAGIVTSRAIVDGLRR
jgi:Flp pilus assembly protein TadB